MSSKVKRDGKKRRAEFDSVLRKLKTTAYAFFIIAAREANERNAGQKGWVNIERKTVMNDLGSFELAEPLGRFDAPQYVHDKVDLALGRELPPPDADKSRGPHKRAAAGGAHAHL